MQHLMQGTKRAVSSEIVEREDPKTGLNSTQRLKAWCPGYETGAGVNQVLHTLLLTDLHIREGYSILLLKV